MQDNAALVREIRRIAGERDRAERRQQRIDHALAQALAVLRERPEHRP